MAKKKGKGQVKGKGEGKGKGKVKENEKEKEKKQLTNNDIYNNHNSEATPDTSYPKTFQQNPNRPKTKKKSTNRVRRNLTKQEEINAISNKAATDMDTFLASLEEYPDKLACYHNGICIECEIRACVQQGLLVSCEPCGNGYY